MILPLEAGIGAVPEYEAKAAAEENRPTSRTSPRIFAATSGPTPQIESRFAGRRLVEQGSKWAVPHAWRQCGAPNLPTVNRLVRLAEVKETILKRLPES